MRGAERRAEERRAAAEAEEKRRKEQEATARRAEEARKAEEARQRAAARRKEEERRRAEERKIAKLTPEMVRISGGSFRMGSPESETGRHDDERRHEVRVEAFSIGKHEVTFAEYDRFAEATGRRKPNDRGRGRRPVIEVSWDDATAYARWLSEETGRRYRLPTEAEWEYAARAGTQTSRHWGDDASRACDYANVADLTAKGTYSYLTIHACRDGHVHTAPVGSFEANGWGLHDLLGNVSEWTCSEYDGGYGGGESRCASGAGRRVIRGGSWSDDPAWVRSATRYRIDPGYRLITLGFRLAQD